jgi:hypothetical protein
VVFDLAKIGMGALQHPFLDVMTYIKNLKVEMKKNFFALFAKKLKKTSKFGKIRHAPA